MPEQQAKVEADRQAIIEAKQKGPVATARTYFRLSGPGWLQSALTLGGGSLSNGLYLGILAGFGMLWLQPLAMVMGIVMLSAIGYVAMSTQERPFQAINRHINPVLGWSWALASLAANMVWSLPQFSLASGVLQQNLLPGVLGPDSSMDDTTSKIIISAAILAITLGISWAYDSGGWGIKLYETLLKVVVAGIVLCFVGVVIVITREGSLDWGAVFAGFIPDPTKLWEPGESFTWLLEAVPAADREFWSDLIVREQQNVMIGATATAVGINMTFLLPYSMLRRGWDKHFRGLAIFDLSTGMFIPFILATSCVVIAAANQFHPDVDSELALLQSGSDGQLPELPEKFSLSPKYSKAPASAWLKQKVGAETFGKVTGDELGTVLGAWTKGELDPQKLDKPEVVRVAETLNGAGRAERLMIFHLERKDAGALAKSLAPLTGNIVANTVFGIGVVGMALSSITLLMLISGFVICEMLGLPPKGWPNRLGMLAAVTGVLGPFWAGDVLFYLAVPTSVFGMMLLPLAYLTFFFMMNSKSLLGDNIPKGGHRVAWNLCMGVAASLATAASLYSVWLKAGRNGLYAVAALVALVVIVHFVFPRNAGKKQ